MNNLINIINILNDLSNSILELEIKKFDKCEKDLNALVFLNEIKHLLYIDEVEKYEVLNNKLICLEDIFKKILFTDKFEFIFSGSLSKYTYIDGYSDVDIFFPICKQEPFKRTPNDSLVSLASKLFHMGIYDYSLSEKKNSLVGRFNNIKVDLVPVVYSSNYLLFPSTGGSEWNKIYPNKTINKLVQNNSERAKLLITLIRIFKLVFYKLYNLTQIKGYHIEMLAINSLSDNTSFKITDAFLHGLESIKKKILYQIIDETQQYEFIDQNLGQSNSEERIDISLKLNDIINDFKRNYFKDLVRN